MRRLFQEELQSIGEELKVQFQSAQQSCKGFDVTSVIDSILEQHARWGRVPLPNDDDTDSLYNLPPPPRSERSGRGSILRGRTTESRGSSPPGGVIPPPGPPPGGSSSSSSSSDSESDGPKDLGNEISKLIRELRKKDKKNRITKQPEAVFLGKAPKMKEPEVFDGDRENYIPWMKAVKEYMTVRSIDFNNDATRIHCWDHFSKAIHTNGTRIMSIPPRENYVPIPGPHTLRQWTTTSVTPTRNATIPTRWLGCTGSINLGATRLASQLTSGESEWPYTKRRPKWKEKS
jgi:hypothetical protein